MSERAPAGLDCPRHRLANCTCDAVFRLPTSSGQTSPATLHRVSAEKALDVAEVFSQHFAGFEISGHNPPVGIDTENRSIEPVEEGVKGARLISFNKLNTFITNPMAYVVVSDRTQ
jgi:hypothetical protein